MTERSVPLPKFGEWDVNNPAAAAEFSVIFDKARHARRASRLTLQDPDSPSRKDETVAETVPLTKASAGKSPTRKSSFRKRWLCCTNPTYAES